MIATDLPTALRATPPPCFLGALQLSQAFKENRSISIPNTNVLVANYGIMKMTGHVHEHDWVIVMKMTSRVYEGDQSGS